VSVLDKILGEGASDAVPQVLEIPVLLRLWQEDKVWNGEAVDLPVAVFGETFEETASNLQTAVISHLEALQEIGKLKETADELRAGARKRRVSVNEMGSNQSFMKFNAGLQDERVVCIA